MADIKELLVQYKQLLVKSIEDGNELSDVDVMEELGIDIDTLNELKSLREKDEEPVQSVSYEEGRRAVARGLDEEFELAIGERSYIQEEEEELEEAPVLDEDKPDEYYEDMNENQWAEIEAAVEEEKERERVAKIKKEREIKAQKKRDAESRKKREEELRKKAEQANKVAGGTVVDDTSTTASVEQGADAAPVISTEQNQNVSDVIPQNDGIVPNNIPETIPVTEPVIVEDGNFKPQSYYGDAQPTSEDHHDKPQPGLEVQAPQTDNVSGDYKPDYSAPHVPSGVNNEYKQPQQNEPVSQEMPVPPVGPAPIPTAEWTPGVQDNQPHSVPLTTEPESHNQPVTQNVHNETYADIEAAEYSRQHRFEQEQASQQPASVGESGQSGASQFQKEEFKPGYMPTQAFEPGVQPPSEDIYYSNDGVPLSIVNRLSHEDVVSVNVPAPAKDPAAQKEQLASAYSAVYATHDQDVADIRRQIDDIKAQLKEARAAGKSEEVISSYVSDIDYHASRIHAMETEKARVEEAVSNGTISAKTISYIPAAKSQLAAYEKETFDVTKQLASAKESLHQMRERPGVSAQDIKVKEAEIARHQDRLKAIGDDRQRIIDYMKNGPRQMSRNDVAGSEYSRNHKMEVQSAAAGELPDNPESKLFHSSANMKGVHRARMATLMAQFGGRFANAVRNATGTALDEDEDLNRADRMKARTLEVAGIAGAFVASSQVGKELQKLGLDKLSIMREIEDIGVITGVGDVTKMSIKQLKEELVKGGGKLSLNELKDVLAKQGCSLPFDRQKKILDAIELKERLKLHNTKIADIALRNAGEYANLSVGGLKKLLKDSGLSPEVRAKAEIALQYKRLSKLNFKAKRRWTRTFGFAKGIARRVAQNNEYLGDLISMGSHAGTAYRIGRGVYNVGKKVITGNKMPKPKASKKVEKFLRRRTRDDLIKSSGIKTAQKTAGKMVGVRADNLVKGGKKVQKAAKGGATVVKKIGELGSKVVAGAKAAITVVGKAIGAIIAALTGPVGFVLLMMLILGAIVALLFSFIFGDSNNGTSVPEMVEYLNAKNAAWVEEINEKALSTPTSTSSQGYDIDEYTRIYFKYVDEDGDTCLVTDNTKELISMAAVYFEQDFSNADAVYEYLDKMWDASHSVAYTEGEIYGCDGTVCINTPDAQGANIQERMYNCNQKPLLYVACFPMQQQVTLRDQVFSNSFRFYNNQIYRDVSTKALYGQYSGISGFLDESAVYGYGCATDSTKWFKCTDLNSITNSEVLKKLVDATGISYSTLKSQGGCTLKHSATSNQCPGWSEGSHVSGCSTYDKKDVEFYLGFSGLPCSSGASYTFTWNSGTGKYEHVDPFSGQALFTFKGNGSAANGQYNGVNSITIYANPGHYQDGQERFSFTIPYYRCKEYTCIKNGNQEGHPITFHVCNGHNEKVCGGHVDLTVKMTIISFDKIFHTPVADLPYYHNGDHGGDVDMTRLCTHAGYAPEDMTSVDWKCGKCGVKYIVGVGVDYSEAEWEPITDANGNRIYDMNKWIPADIDWCKNIYEQDWQELYDVYVTSSLYTANDSVVSSRLPAHEMSLPIPLYNQLDYPDAPYGRHGTVSSHGCGITCVTMLTSYYKDKEYSPAYLARIYGYEYNTDDGSKWSLFPASAADLGLPFIDCGGANGETYDWNTVVNALQAGKPVISIQDSRGIFTSGGHFILLTGITEDGKILVNDPNGANYAKNATMISGFANGFTQDQVKAGGSAYWIYDAKPVPEAE